MQKYDKNYSFFSFQQIILCTRRWIIDLLIEKYAIGINLEIIFLNGKNTIFRTEKCIDTKKNISSPKPCTEMTCTYILSRLDVYARSNFSYRLNIYYENSPTHLLRIRIHCLSLIRIYCVQTPYVQFSWLECIHKHKHINCEKRDDFISAQYIQLIVTLEVWRSGCA